MENINNNLIIQSFWHGSELSVMEQLCINSFIYHGHEFHLYTYDKIKNVPKKCIVLDANTIVNRDTIFYDSRGGISGFANYFRIHLLNLKGGWWVDLDLICIKPFDFKEDFCFCSEYSSKGKTNYSNCCIKSPKNSDFLEDYIQIFDQMFEEYDVIPWGLTGPVLIEHLLKFYNSKKMVQKPNVFCPIKWNEIKTIIEEDNEIPSKGYAIHLYNELWRLNKMDKNLEYPQNSIYELLKKKYLN